MPLKPPPLDNNGDVVPHDHEEIEPADGIIRRISANYLTPGPDGKPRISSMAFQGSTGTNGGMSVDIEKSISSAGLNVRDHVTSPQFMGSVRFTAGELRGEGLLVGFHPVVGNDHHGEVWGNFTGGKRKALLRMARWFVEIDGVTLN